MEATLQSFNIQVPAIVAELLKPISADLPAGKDASSEEAYFKLEMEIAKVSPDYNLCIDLASEILNKISKDLRVAAWLCFAWFRNERIPGFTNGLILIAELLRKFGNGLFPAAPVHRGKSLQFLNSSRVVKLVEAERVAGDMATVVLELSQAFEQLLAESRKELAGQAAELKALAQIISAHATAAKEMLRKPQAQPKPEPLKPSEKRAEEKPGKGLPPPGAEAVPEKPKEKPTPESGVGPKDFSAASEKDAVVLVKKALKYFIEEEKDEVKKYAPYVFGISRVLVWGKLVMPPSEDLVTSINAPDIAIQSKIREWFAGKDWDRLITAIELNFLDEDSGFRYWLTAQRYICGALEQKGGGAVRAAEEIRFHLAILLQRFPDFFRLKFSNKTQFSDEETFRWIDESVKSIIGKTGQGEAVLPPILGEDYESINREYRAACADLPAKFEKNMHAMQQGMAGEIRPKGRFLRALNLANFCFAAKQYELAKTHVSGLLDKIEAYHLAEWEPALCTAVWESAYLVNKKLIAGEKNKELQESLERQQKDLFTRIGNIDGVLALKLAHLK